MLQDTRPGREGTRSEDAWPKGHIFPMPGEDMQLHRGVLDVGRGRGSYGAPVFPWQALLMAFVLGLGPLGMLVCSVAALATDASSEHSLAKGLQLFQRGDF